MEGTLAIIGTGRLGEALLRGLLRSFSVRPEQVVCTARRDRRTAELASTHGVKATGDNREAVARADVVVLGLKPQVLPGVLAEVGEVFHAGQTVISLAAGITTARIESHLPPGVPVVRVMTNTPVLVDEAMSVVAAGAHATDRHVAVAEEILSPVGRVVRMGEEHLDSVTALAGSGPAYLFLVAEAMIDAGVLLGLPREAATELVTQTLLGSATLLRDGERHPVELREMVTSPGGTTSAALRELEAHGVRTAFVEAVAAAKQRAQELSG